MDSTSADNNDPSHARSDVDKGPRSFHHTLGAGAEQAAPGNHTHVGPWVPLDLESDYYADTGYAPLTVRLVSGLRAVFLRGTVIFPTGYIGATTIATLPPTYRPTAGDVSFPVFTGAGAQLVVITTGGIIRLLATMAFPSYMTLDGINYSLD